MNLYFSKALIICEKILVYCAGAKEIFLLRGDKEIRKEIEELKEKSSQNRGTIAF